MVAVVLLPADCLAPLRGLTIIARSYAATSRWVRAKMAIVALFSIPPPPRRRAVWAAAAVVVITPTKARWRCRAPCEAGNGKQAGGAFSLLLAVICVFLYTRVLSPTPVRVIFSSAVSSSTI